MSVDEEDLIKQPTQLFDLGVVGIAAVLTLSGLALCFFTFRVPTDKPAPLQLRPQPTEVTIGIGQGQTIHPRPPSSGDENMIAPDPARHP